MKGVTQPLGQEIICDRLDKFTATHYILDEQQNWQLVVDETRVRE